MRWWLTESSRQVINDKYYGLRGGETEMGSNVQHLVIKILGWIWEYGLVGTLLGWLTLAIVLFGLLWGFCEPAGIQGSLVVVLTLGIISCVVSVLLILFTQPLRHYLVYTLVHDYLSQHKIPQDVVLVSSGPGGAIVSGYVCKALQVLRGASPPSIVLDLHYDHNGEAQIANYATLRPESFQGKVPVIVLSAVSTGKNLAKLREIEILQNAKVFAFCVENSFRGTVDFAVLRASRAIIPWPRH